MLLIFCSVRRGTNSFALSHLTFSRLKLRRESSHQYFDENPSTTPFINHQGKLSPANPSISSKTTKVNFTMLGRLSRLSKSSRPAWARGYQMQLLSPVPALAALDKNMRNRTMTLPRKLTAASCLCTIGMTTVCFVSWDIYAQEESTKGIKG